jgi:hypothetical protein
MDRRKLLAALGLSPTLSSPSISQNHADKKPEGPHAVPHFHFCGIHMAKSNSKLQFITQHYCASHTGGKEGDVLQCTLFDGQGANAKLIGVEFLISDAAYRKLPDSEKKLWHAHTYEVLGGGLIAPQMDKKTENEFMKVVMTMWGKAWHTWPDPSTPIPMGEPLLIWSLMGDGQVDEKLQAARDKEFAVDSKKLQSERVKEFGLLPPNVAPPTIMDTLGRQWTNTGEDKPTKAN